MMPPGDNPTAAPSDQENWDELLSAYLDDELSAEERARVDEHLAGNADARRLLAELRALTETLHQAPREAAPRSMTDAVLQAAEQRMLSVDAQRDAGRGGSSLPIGRSRRGWFWAVAAIAAAVMLMVSQQEEPAPTVAKSNANADSVEHEPASLHAAGVEADAAPAAGSATPDAPAAIASAPPQPLSDSEPVDFSARSATREDRVAEESAVADEMSPADAPETRSLEAFAARGVPLPAAPAADGGRGGFGGETSDGGLMGELPGAPIDNPLVVRFDLRPEAFANRYMEGVLGDNGIAVESKPLTLGRQAAKAEDTEATDQGTLSDDGRQPRDIMLVDAPSPQIVDVVSQLNRDYTNVFRIEVVQPPAKKAPMTYNFLQAESVRQEQVANQLGTLSRSNVGPMQAANAPAMEQQIATRNAVEAPEPASAKPLAKQRRAQPSRPLGRAIRIEPVEKLAVDTTSLFAEINRYAFENRSGGNRRDSRAADDSGSESEGDAAAAIESLPIVFFMQPASAPDVPVPAEPRR